MKTFVEWHNVELLALPPRDHLVVCLPVPGWCVGWEQVRSVLMQ